MNDTAEFEFNSKYGLTSYITPFVNLFCVTFNNAPKLGTYFQTTTDEPSAEVVRQVTEDPLNQMLADAAFDKVGSVSGKPLYTIGEKMKSFVTVTDGLNSQYSDSFPLPRGDSFGVCNNYKSAFFMQDDAATCNQVVDLDSACTTTLNADYYTTDLNVYMGQGATAASAKTVTVTEVYTYDATTFEYTS